MTIPRVGDRVRMTGVMPQDPSPIPVGTEGRVKWVNPNVHQIGVDWFISPPRSLILLTTDPFVVVIED